VRSSTEPTPDIGADSAFDDLDSLAHDLRAKTRSMPNIESRDSPVHMSAADIAQAAEENGRKRVALELADYEKDTTCKVKSNAHLLQFWQVCVCNVFLTCLIKLKKKQGKPDEVPTVIPGST
jgi:hypothetical protein